jgi:hypothetical protein
MHATIPSLPQGVHQLLLSGVKSGERSGELTGLIDRAEGRMLANGMAVLLKLGFGFLLSEGLDQAKADQARAFFEENFVIRDPDVEGGIRYYQGKFLIRTRKAEDDMNVWLKFCPDPTDLYHQTPLGKRLNPAAILVTEALTEEEAERVEANANQVDLVIRFKDSKSILGLIERPDADVVGLLLENLVQLTGNFGHMFKLGAIGKNVELMLKGAA